MYILLCQNIVAMRPVHRPQLYELDNDSVRLSWEPAIIGPGQSRRPVRYVIEMREIPDKTWSKVASDVLDTNYKIRGLRSKQDYEFRVRALIDGETSEPSMPVPLYRRSGIMGLNLIIFVNKSMRYVYSNIYICKKLQFLDGKLW